MATLRELKGRIGSVASSEKITGAMKMISSAKMHKAESSLRRLQPYRSNIETIIANLLSSDATFSSPLCQVRPVEHATIVVLGSDDGLCGAYNANIAKFLMNRIVELRNTHGENLRITIIPVGKKMAKAVRFLSDDTTIVAHAEVNSKSDGQQVKDFQNTLINEFLTGATDSIDIVYMHFRSVARQTPVADRILPLSPQVLAGENIKPSVKPYLFEPSAQEIFDSAIPMYILSLVQEVFVENRASEQAARIMAMQSANDNAKKLLDQLRLEYNKLRQQSITTELLDIVGGQVRD